MRIYVASSWRNPHQPEIVSLCQKSGHEVYDFRNPAIGNTGFHWETIDPGWENWSVENYRRGINHPIADYGFLLDMQALMHCDLCLLVCPCGRSAHLELGFAAGAGKKTAILLNKNQFEPELMYKMANHIFTDKSELKGYLLEVARQEREADDDTT